MVEYVECKLHSTLFIIQDNVMGTHSIPDKYSYIISGKTVLLLPVYVPQNDASLLSLTWQRI